MLFVRPRSLWKYNWNILGVAMAAPIIPHCECRSKSIGVIHDRALRLSTESACLQSDGDRQLSRYRADLAHARYRQRRAKIAALRRAQSQHAHAHAAGWRLCAVGTKRHFAIPRAQAPGARPAPAEEKTRLDVTRRPFLGPAPLDPTCPGF